MTFVIIKSIATVLDPFLLVFLRGTLATSLMFLYLLIFKNESLSNKRSIQKGAILGVMLAAMYVMQTFGLQFTSSGHSAFITSTFVIITPIIMALQFKHRMTKIGVIAIGIVAIGLFFFTYEPGTSLNIGDVITFLATVIGAYHIIYGGFFVKNTDTLGLIFYQFLFTTLIAGVIAIGVNDPLPVFTNELIGAIVYLGVLGTLFCYFVSIWAQKHVSAVTVALIFACEPIFASTAAYFFLGEQFGMKEVLGAGLILLGVVMYDLPIFKWIRKSSKKALPER